MLFNCLYFFSGAEIVGVLVLFFSLESWSNKKSKKYFLLYKVPNTRKLHGWKNVLLAQDVVGFTEEWILTVIQLIKTHFDILQIKWQNMLFLIACQNDTNKHFLKMFLDMKPLWLDIPCSTLQQNFRAIFSHVSLFCGFCHLNIHTHCFFLKRQSCQALYLIGCKCSHISRYGKIHLKDMHECIIGLCLLEHLPPAYPLVRTALSYLTLMNDCLTVTQL